MRSPRPWPAAIWPLPCLLAVVFAPSPAAAAAAASKKPAPFEALYSAATTLYEAGSFAPALEAYEKAYAVEPRPEALYGRARCLDQLGRYDAAVALYERFLVDAAAHEGAPRAAAYLLAALHAAGTARLAARDFPAAKRYFERGLEGVAKRPPPDGDTMPGALEVGLGDAEASLGHTDAASARLRHALSAKLTPADRAKATALLEALAPAAEPETVPAGAGDPSGPTGTPLTPPPRRGPGAGLWIGLGAGAAVAGGLAAVLAVLLVRPNVDLGWARVDHRP